jgi:hypothetical protein
MILAEFGRRTGDRSRRGATEGLRGRKGYGRAPRRVWRGQRKLAGATPCLGVSAEVP